VWQKTDYVQLSNPTPPAQHIKTTTPGLLAFVSFSIDKTLPPLSLADATKKLVAVASLLHKGKLCKHPTTNKATALATSSQSPNLVLIPMSSLTCKLKKNDVQYHNQLDQTTASKLYAELQSLLTASCPENVTFESGNFGDKQALVVDSTRGPQVHSIII